MKLLFDANLSRHLVRQLDAEFPGCVHASALGPSPDDVSIWNYAKLNGLTIVSKDSDFYRMSAAWGAPPKVIWLRMGNAGTFAIASQLRARANDCLVFFNDPAVSLLIIGQPF